MAFAWICPMMSLSFLLWWPMPTRGHEEFEDQAQANKRQVPIHHKNPLTRWTAMAQLPPIQASGPYRFWSSGLCEVVQVPRSEAMSIGNPGHLLTMWAQDGDRMFQLLILGIISGENLAWTLPVSSFPRDHISHRRDRISAWKRRARVRAIGFATFDRVCHIYLYYLYIYIFIYLYMYLYIYIIYIYYIYICVCVCVGIL